jgi:hypothetical protein
VTVSVDHDIKKIVARDWTDLRDEWIDYIPQMSGPWPLPEHELIELPSLLDAVKDVRNSNQKRIQFDEDIEGFREALLHEAVATFHKACNVLSAGASNGQDGFRTWGRSSAYHAAFFGMRAVLSILGIALVQQRELGTSWFQVDTWVKKDRRPRSPTESQFGTLILQRGGGVEHKELWQVYSRMLRIVKVPKAIWPLMDDDPLGLKTIEPAECSRIRHRIHYRAAGWLFSDIDDRKSCDDFSMLAKRVGANEAMDPAHHDFSIRSCVARHFPRICIVGRLEC